MTTTTLSPADQLRWVAAALEILPEPLSVTWSQHRGVTSIQLYRLAEWAQWCAHFGADEVEDIEHVPHKSIEHRAWAPGRIMRIFWLETEGDK